MRKGGDRLRISAPNFVACPRFALWTKLLSVAFAHSPFCSTFAAWGGGVRCLDARFVNPQ
jgi:hypothetical protein